MKFIRAVAWFPGCGGVPWGAGLKAWYQLGRGLIEVADVIVFNQNHRRGQGIEQHVQAVIGLNQVGTEVFNLSAKGCILLLQSL